jgi:2-polyprenyl-6-methoxyphenol hydroxylase-like FAD-dependent oxidoreductase
MNLGIQDAVALGGAVAAVLGGAPEALLDDYGTTRRPFAQQVLTLTSRLTRVATAPPALRPLRNAGLRLLGAAPAARRGLAWRLSGLVYR